MREKRTGVVQSNTYHKSRFMAVDSGCALRYIRIGLRFMGQIYQGENSQSK